MVQSSLTPEDMYALKTAIWEGLDNKELMERFKVSYSIVIGVKAGRTYPHIPWPDGSIGAMSEMRKELLKEGRKRATVTGKHLDREPTRPIARLEDIKFLDNEARKLGFMNNEAMYQHFYHQAINERMARENEEQRLKTEAYEEAERVRMLPENVEARRLARAALPVERDDICDPALQEMIPESELEGLDIPVVQVAQSEMDEALLLAIRICFNLFTRRQWSQDHVLKNIYMIKGKIERYWEEHPVEQTAL